MNLRQRSSRYSAAVLFCAGVTGVTLIAAFARSGFRLDFEFILASCLVVSLILHARAGFALSRAQQELEMLRGLVKRFDPRPAKTAPVVNFEPVGGVGGEDAQALESVKGAIENDRIDLYLQPIINLPARELCCFEAFSRLRKANGSVLSPEDYLGAAERANRISVIDNMILLRAVQALRHLGRQSGPYRMFCNISPATIFDQDFFTRFTDYLDANEDLAQHLVFEFTYPAVEMMHERVKENLHKVAARGFAFSVDHVRRFDLNWPALRTKNFRFIKVASSLLNAEAAKGDLGRARLNALKRALAEHEIELIVEKVETEAEMQTLIDLGVGYGQGALFGPPRKASAYIQQPADMAAAS